MFIITLDTVVVQIKSSFAHMHARICTVNHVSTYRFGKLLWFNLPEDVLASDEPLNIKTFAEFVFDTNHSQIFDTE